MTEPSRCTMIVSASGNDGINLHCPLHSNGIPIYAGTMPTIADLFKIQKRHRAQIDKENNGGS